MVEIAVIIFILISSHGNNIICFLKNNLKTSRYINNLDRMIDADWTEAQAVKSAQRQNFQVRENGSYSVSEEWLGSGVNTFRKSGWVQVLFSF